MSDYGRPLEFAVSLDPIAADHETQRALARRAESLGLDLIGMQDHPYLPRFLDTFALLPTILAETERIRVFPDVANLPVRPPALLAKTAASLDILSGGRFELGLGAGFFWDAIEAIGAPRRSPGEAVAALEEAIELIRLCWSGAESIRFEGRFYATDRPHSGSSG